MSEEFNFIELQIIKQLNEFLEEVDNKGYRGDTRWTKGIKERIGDLGTTLGYDVATSGFTDKFDREWLYDIVWYTGDTEKRLTRVPLIAECEWDKKYGGIKYDFEKLLVGNADLRLMICQWKLSEIDNLLSKFKKSIDSFQNNSGNRFMFAILNSETEDNFHYSIYTK